MFQSTHTAILSFGQMTKDDALGGRIQLNEPLNIRSGDTFTDLGNACLDDIPKVNINGFKMHAHLILPVGIFSSIKDGACSRDFDYPKVDIAKTPGG